MGQSLNRFTLLLLLVSLLAGCRPEKPIEVYSEKKPADIMMVGISLRGNTTWTIKLVNAREKILAAEDDVYTFASSFNFSADPSNPEWKLPESWKKLDVVKPFRKATFEINDSPDPEQRTQVIVSELAMGQQSGSRDQTIAENINRWRKQMRIDPVLNYSVKKSGEQVEFSAGDLIVPYMKKVKVGGQTMYFEKIEGTRPKVAASAPFMNGMPNMGMHGDIAKMMAAKKEPQSSPPPVPFDYDVPAGWQPADSGSVSILKFSVGKGESPAQVSVSKFSAPAVNWESTVTMWQGQFKVAKTTGEELQKITEDISSDSIRGNLIRITGKDDKKGQSLLGVMIEHATGKWFFKLQGPDSTIDAERKNFESFVKSIQFRSDEKK
ncbi:MAG: hypothetical protein VX768_12325 [Planctomycetota bacterium]|nr:hypothetical protein [Planctomycetota bacterium]